MKRIILIAAAAVIAISSHSQAYETGIGLRGGLSNGITVKHFIGNDVALEGILHTRWRGFGITGLFEIHANAFGVDELFWYYGGGGHIGFYPYYDNSPFDDEFSGNTTVIGVDGVLGIEYNIREIPINVSVDWKPTVNLIGLSGPYLDGGALSVRYTF